MSALWIEPDADEEPTVWTHDSHRQPVAVLRRSDLSIRPLYMYEHSFHAAARDALWAVIADALPVDEPQPAEGAA